MWTTNQLGGMAIAMNYPKWNLKEVEFGPLPIEPLDEELSFVSVG